MTPLPSSDSNSVICIVCGVAYPAGTETCPSCGRSHTVAVGTAGPESLPADSPPVSPLPAAPAEKPILFEQLLVTFAVIVCAGIAFIAPGVAIGLAVLLTPVVIRTLLIAREQNWRSAPPPASEFFGAAVASLLVVITIGVAAAATFFPVCYVSFFAGAAVSQPYTNGLDSLEVGFIVGGIVGAIPALYVAFIMIRKLWPRKSRVPG